MRSTLALLVLVGLTTAHPRAGVYSVEETIPAGTRFGITSPLGSNERVLVKATGASSDELSNAAAPRAEVVAAEPVQAVAPSPSSSSGASERQAPVAVTSVVTSTSTKTGESSKQQPQGNVTPKKQEEPRRAKVVLGGGSSAGAVSGVLILDQAGPAEPVRITGEVAGLTPGKHGFHIHVYGDTGDACAAAAGHFNPALLKHGAPDSQVRHVGDLGNILASDAGVAAIDITDALATLYDGPNSIVGRGVVVHAGEDDLGLGGDDGSMATGNAGGRVACGVIGLANPTKKL